MALREIFAKFVTEFDTDELERGKEKTEETASSLDELADKLKKAAGVAAAAAVLGRIRDFAMEMAALGDEIDKTSQVLDLSTDSLQSLRLAAGFAGVGVEELTPSLTGLRSQMLAAKNGSAEMRALFERLGVTITDSAGNLRNLDDVLPELANGISGLGSETEKAAILTQLMGESGARLLPLMNQGAEGIAAARAELEELGGGMSEEGVAAAAQLTDAMARLDTAMLSVKSRVSEFLLPAITRMVDVFREMAAELARSAEGTQIFASAAIVLGSLMGARLLPVFVRLIAANAALIAGWIAMVAGVAVLVLIFEDLWAAIEGRPSLFGDFTDAVNDFVEAGQNMEGILGTIARGWGRMIEIAENGIDKLARFGRAIGLDVGVAPDEAEFTNQRGLGGISPEEANRLGRQQRQEREDRLAGDGWQNTGGATQRGLGGVGITADGRVIQVPTGRPSFEAVMGGLAAPARPAAGDFLRSPRRPGGRLDRGPQVQQTVQVDVAVTANGVSPQEVTREIQRNVRREVERAGAEAVDAVEAEG